MQNRPTEDQIRTQFVTSLMNYFKIEEDVFLRSHIDELIRPISPSRYSTFLNRLSSRDMPYKTAFEKIALIVKEFEEEMQSPLDQEVLTRTDQLYRLMYDLRRDVSLIQNGEKSALERFEAIRFTSIRRKEEENPLLDETDINVIKILTKKWIYDYVSLDRGLFETRVSHEYRNEIVRRERSKNDLLSPPATAKLIASAAKR